MDIKSLKKEYPCLFISGLYKALTKQDDPSLWEAVLSKYWFKIPNKIPIIKPPFKEPGELNDDSPLRRVSSLRFGIISLKENPKIFREGSLREINETWYFRMKDVNRLEIVKKSEKKRAF